MKGILFKPEMIKAIIEGRKTVTRRIIKELQPPDDYAFCGDEDGIWAFAYKDSKGVLQYKGIKPRYQVGEIVYIKEAHYCYGYWVKNGKTKTGKQAWRFRATKRIRFLDNPPEEILKNSKKEKVGWFKRSALFLPADLARYFIEITANSAERFYLDKIAPEELNLEGGDPAIPQLKKLNSLWVFRHAFKLIRNLKEEGINAKRD